MVRNMNDNIKRIQKNIFICENVRSISTKNHQIILFILSGLPLLLLGPLILKPNLDLRLCQPQLDG